MIWFTWRRFRANAAIAIGALAVLGVLLILTRRGIADAYAAANLDACTGDCSDAINAFLRRARAGTNGNVLDLALMAMYGLPALIGVFWGAPLVARELETGTHQLAWSQTVTRTRWLATKLAIIGAAAVAAAGLLSWAVTTSARRVDEAAGNRIAPLVFGARGVVPIGYALFAFVLGVTVGMLVRRSVPAMATTLAIYVAAVAAMPTWIRAHLVPPQHGTSTLDLSRLDEITIGSDGGMSVLGQGPDNAWVLSNRTLTSAGELFTGQGRPAFCGAGPGNPGDDPRACLEWVRSLNLRQDLSYHPGSHFWSLQWAEAGIFAGLALLLAGFCFWYLRRRLT